MNVGLSIELSVTLIAVYFIRLSVDSILVVLVGVTGMNIYGILFVESSVLYIFHGHTDSI